MIACVISMAKFRYALFHRLGGQQNANPIQAPH